MILGVGVVVGRCSRHHGRETEWRKMTLRASSLIHFVCFVEQKDGRTTRTSFFVVRLQSAVLQPVVDIFVVVVVTA